ncbi:MAG: ribonuclease III [Clostridia bacterium]|nr:ribonuclease III [Clostridia bacterium]
MSHKALEAAIGYKFRDDKLLLTALTHTSYANERNTESYERQEFLGDSVLQLGISRFLYMNYPDLSEGKMTRLRAKVVCEETLAALAKELCLGEYIRIGRGEEQTGGRMRTSILADVVEAVLAAVYLDGGVEAAIAFIERFFPKIIIEAAAGQGTHDYKTALQEKMQCNPNAELVYLLVSEEGPPHAREFTTRVLLGKKVLGEGRGKSKKASEQMAAKEALENEDA